MNMFQNVLRQLSGVIKPKPYIIKNKNPSCGRDVCLCLHKLELDKYEDYEFYKGCYDNWLYFNKGLNN